MAPAVALRLVLGAIAIAHGSCAVAPRATRQGGVIRASAHRAAVRAGDAPSTMPAAATATADADGSAELVGFERFVRTNPRSDRFGVRGLDHLEFYCPDATTASSRFMFGLDMAPIARFESDAHAHSVVLQSGAVRFVFTAPSAHEPDERTAARARAPPGFARADALRFVGAHGTAVRAIGLEVDNCARAYAACVAHGGRPARAPARMARTGNGMGEVEYAEVELYGDVVLRLLSSAERAAERDMPHDDDGMCDEAHALRLLPGYCATAAAPERAVGSIAPLLRVDHVVGNVPALRDVWPYIARMTGFHPFAEFVAEDVGTVDSGLNSIVLASNCETVLLPLNEPTYGTRRKSQIQTYLEQHGGPGVQHIALLTPDIFATVRAMRARAARGGFDFMARPPADYYGGLGARLERLATEAASGAGGVAANGGLSAAQLAEAEELGVLVDRDEQGVLLQIFTAPVSDRKTLFLEVIQRVGCEAEDDGRVRGGCGGFGKGNFAVLFKTVEDFLGDEA
ncbi:hypothetical protein KFE25_007582 [Diacronema lutheri]|uniref:4-hydroxyphenylpyruvate dioxygenase n=4 Tax=Diacronema lutheri TaxID=2081491 RepID=A0A8J5XRF5_DIALT|nr:hypothetical protein KFE25_007582 [Diacronema lutheri]